MPQMLIGWVQTLVRLHRRLEKWYLQPA